MPRSVRVQIAGREYEIEELRARQNAGWRKKLEGVYEPLVKRLEGAGNTDLSKGQDVAALVRETAGVLLQSPDTLAGLVFDYAPNVARDRERILEEAYDSELLGAFVEVLKLAFPFGGLVERIAGLARLGQESARTGPS
jgi:hypothetical protein